MKPKAVLVEFFLKFTFVPSFRLLRNAITHLHPNFPPKL